MRSKSRTGEIAEGGEALMRRRLPLERSEKREAPGGNLQVPEFRGLQAEGRAKREAAATAAPVRRTRKRKEHPPPVAEDGNEAVGCDWEVHAGPQAEYTSRIIGGLGYKPDASTEWGSEAPTRSGRGARRRGAAYRRLEVPRS